MIDLSAMKLGKRAARIDRRTLRLSEYLPSAWVPEAEVDYTNGVTDWGMMQNDILGCCTISAVGHAIQVWTMSSVDPYTGMETPGDDIVLNYYEKWDGYVPGDPSTDQGGVEIDVLNAWRKEPLGFGGYKLLAYASPEPQNMLHVKRSISRFGGIYIGLELPVSAQTQDVWGIVPNDGGAWGGHAVFCPAYDSDTITCITWGKLQKMTWAFWNRYCSESYCLFPEVWEGAISRGPGGIDMAKLNSDLQSITG